jgi:hydroxymethylglutaryl-CoA lyase
VSETFNKKNLGQDFQKSQAVLKSMLEEARRKNFRVRGYISTAFGCPYEGNVSYASLEAWVQFFLDYDVEEIVLGDTIGVARVSQIKEIFTKLFSFVGKEKLGFHAHDTRGTGIMNIMAAYEVGIRSFDSSSGGLGGCPYAPGASGNVATEDVLSFCEMVGEKIDVNICGIVKASTFIFSHLKKYSLSKSFYYFQGKCAQSDCGTL